MRLKYSKGFGIQSPSAYAFFRDVVFEQLSYYAYSRLSCFDDPRLDEETCRLLFRIVNYVSPSLVVDVFPRSAAPAGYMSAVSSRIRSVVLSPSADCDRESFAMAERMGFKFDVRQTCDAASIRQMCADNDCVVHVNRTDDAAALGDVVGALLSSMRGPSIMIMDGINKSSVKDVWRKACGARSVSSAFDLFDEGILMFDANFSKHYYKLNY